jgi:hypothetical protein
VLAPGSDRCKFTRTFLFLPLGIPCRNSHGIDNTYVVKEFEGTKSMGTITGEFMTSHPRLRIQYFGYDSFYSLAKEIHLNLRITATIK